MIKLDHYRSILCLNGTLPDVAFFECGLPIYAADGAANSLMQMGVVPECVIGDLDSILPEHKKRLQNIYHYDQNYCDFEKALLYLREQNALPAIVVGVAGGFIDHVLNNISIFSSVDDCLFYAPPIYGMMLREGSHTEFNLKMQTKLSLIGMPSSVVSTEGLQWELNKSELSFPGANSCFNRVVGERLVINVYSGQVLLMVYEK